MTVKFRDLHINYLKQFGGQDPDYLGNNSLVWAKYVLPQVTFDIYLNRRLNRYELFEYCLNPKNDNLHVLVAILSWGGMRRDHGRMLLKDSDFILSLISDLRNGAYDSRKIAFSIFQKHRENGRLPGLGIGYFTKLICFLSPHLNGYIMDQWVGKSINLLIGEELVNITGDHWVNDRNNPETYEKFCAQIDQLAIILNCSGYEAEKRIFSVGKGKGLWREYLKKNYKK